MKKNRKMWIWIVVAVVVIAVAGGGYALYRRNTAAAAETEQPTLQTAAVYRGDIVLSALGSGNLLPEREMDVLFSSSGWVAEVLVEVGDEVAAGEVLARLDTTDLQRTVTQAEISLRQAEIALESALEPPDESSVQSAQNSVDQAGAALRLAQLQYDAAQNSTTLTDDLRDAQYRLQNAESDYAARLFQYQDGQIGDRIMDQVTQALQAAQIGLVRAQDAADQEAQSARNSLASASDNYQQARAALETLLAEPNALDIESLQLKVQLAQMDLQVAQENLDNAVLVAPFDGIVTAVSVEVGQSVSGSTAAVTVADMEPPLIQFWVEEADMGSAAIGNPVSVVFDALPDITFTGEIVRVEPTLVTVGSTTAVQLWATMDTGGYAEPLFAGMNAEVEVTYGEARNALLVPVEALRELAAGQYAVFVVNSAGELEMRPVVVGLQDYVTAEIVSGLEVGEVVSAGVEDTALTTTSSVDVNTQQMPGSGFFIPGSGGPP